MVAALPALVQLGWHARLFAGRATFPLDLEWMEGGVLLHAQRIAQGKGIYVEPSLDFIPFLYTPLYPALLALLSFILPLGYLLGRLVSIAAFAVALALVVITSMGETQGSRAQESWPRWSEFRRRRRHRRQLYLHWLLLRFGSRGLAFARPASPGPVAGLARAGLEERCLAGLLIALGFFTKQTATILGIGLGLGMLVANVRRGLVYGLAAAATLAAGIGLLGEDLGGMVLDLHFQVAPEPRLSQRGYHRCGAALHAAIRLAAFSRAGACHLGLGAIAQVASQ
jgi:uncharacterized membrane protein YphA (DoxX/SURF4 family)